MIKQDPTSVKTDRYYLVRLECKNIPIAYVNFVSLYLKTLKYRLQNNS